MAHAGQVGVSLLAAVILAGAYVLSHFGHRVPLPIRQRWKALSAGVAVAYVFVQLIPELEEHRPVVAGTSFGALLDAEKRVYSWALAGFLAMSGLGYLAHRPGGAQLWIYRAELAGFAVYWLLIGYLLVHREDPSPLSLALYVFAMGLHAFLVDSDLAEHFGAMYVPGGSILLAACVLLGWELGVADALPETFTSRLFAFVLGGVVVVSMREEHTGEREGRYRWFVAGALAYAAILMLV